MMSVPDRPAAVSRRLFLKALAAGIGTAGLGACGGPAAPAEVTAPTAAVPAIASTQPVTLRIRVGPPWLDEAIKRFESANPGVTVTPVQADGSINLLLDALRTGVDAPDICLLGSDELGVVAPTGALVDLAALPFDGASLKQDMVGAVWSQAERDGHLLALPLGLAVGGLWYREELLRAAGLETDPARLQARITSWDDWIALAEALKAKDADHPLIPNARDDIFWPMVAQQGAGLVEAGKLLVVERGLLALEKTLQVRERGIDGKLSGQFTAIIGGEVAGITGASLLQGFLNARAPQDHHGKWRVLPLPGASFGLGQVLAITTHAARPELAWKLVQSACATVEGANGLLRAGSGLLPAYTPAWRDSLYDQPVDFFGGQKVYRLWAGSAAALPASPPLGAHEQQVAELVNTEVRRVLDEHKDPARALRDAETAALAAIAGLTS